jgi:hypothetical protein
MNVQQPRARLTELGRALFDRLDQDGQNFRVPTRDAYEPSPNAQPGLAEATPGLAIVETPKIFSK